MSSLGSPPQSSTLKVARRTSLSVLQRVAVARSSLFDVTSTPLMPAPQAICADTRSFAMGMKPLPLQMRQGMSILHARLCRSHWQRMGQSPHYSNRLGRVRLLTVCVRTPSWRHGMFNLPMHNRYSRAKTNHSVHSMCVGSQRTSVLFRSLMTLPSARS